MDTSLMNAYSANKINCDLNASCKTQIRHVAKKQFRHATCCFAEVIFVKYYLS